MTGAAAAATLPAGSASAEGSRIGGMVCDDEDGESSNASMGAYRSVSRDRT